jgi:hypothetical protein
MSNQPYDEAEIIREIIEILKHESKSHSQLRQDLIGKGIPEDRVDEMIKSAIDKLYPSDIWFALTKQLIEGRKPTKSEAMVKSANFREVQRHIKLQTCVFIYDFFILCLLFVIMECEASIGLFLWLICPSFFINFAIFYIIRMRSKISTDAPLSQQVNIATRILSLVVILAGIVHSAFVMFIVVLCSTGV